MSKKRYSPEEIVNKLREADVLIGQGQTVAQACKRIGVTSITYYRWRREYGGMKTNQAKRLKELERENSRLKGLLADAELDKAILREAPPQTSEPATKTAGGPTGGGFSGCLREAGVSGVGSVTSHSALSSQGAG